jgi:putative ABC transport system permease protein
MIKTFLLIAIRNLLKNKTTSVIKIAGLAIGLSAIFLIYIYVSFEYSYDKYHENGDRIYRVAYHVKRPNTGEGDNPKTGNNLASMLQNSFPEIESTSRVTWTGEVNILHKNRYYEEQKFMFADPSVLTMFSFPMKQGDRNTALNDRNSVVINSRIAQKYFGDEYPVGKYLDDNMQFKVTGVVDVPENSHFRFDIMASYTAAYDVFPFLKNIEDETIDVNVYTYVMLKKNADAMALEKKFMPFADAHIKKGSYSSINLFLEPLPEIHLNSMAGGYYGEFELSKFTKPLIYLFEILGLIIIGIACFNFINIAIAQIVGRTKEVGVRKIYGSKKSEIFLQFVCEYGLYSLIAVLISMIIVQLSLPLISSILNRQIQVNYSGYFMAASTVLLLVTIFAGAYPSFLIAKVNAVSALHSGLKGPRGNIMRSVLVVSQFTISIILVLTSVYIAKQINHLTEMDMGLNTKDVLVVRMENSKIRKSYELFKSELLRNPNILSVSASSNIPAVTGASLMNLQVEGKEPIPFPYISIDPGFTKNLEIKTIAGRNFSTDYKTDYKTTFLLNKAALKILGIDDPIGKGVVLSFASDDKHTPVSSGQIVGVIDDYSYRPTYDESRGVVFNYDPDRFNAIFIHFAPNKQKEASMMAEDTWKRLFPEMRLNADLLTDEIKNDALILKFHSLQKFITAVAIFSFFIALLGLFGLSLFAAKQRVKEVGIRRVNGASMTELLVLMNRKFMNMVLLSTTISFPLVFFIIEAIKRNSAGSTSLSWSNYGIAFLMVVIFTLLTVSWQSWRAATINPVEALRYE